MEVWKVVSRNENYEVSNLGNIRNKKTKRHLKPNATKSHRQVQVFLYSPYWRHSEQFTLSRLVYNAFARNELEMNQRIGHKDGDIFNNRFENLFVY